jgi:plastocyanin
MIMAKTFQAIASGLALTVILFVPASADPQAASVRIENFVFAPRDVVVSPGATITWTNGDDIPHNLVSAEQRFRSPLLDTGESYSFTFEQPGTYVYFCSLHPHMTGRIVVRPS